MPTEIRTLHYSSFDREGEAVQVFGVAVVMERRRRVQWGRHLRRGSSSTGVLPMSGRKKKRRGG